MQCFTVPRYCPRNLSFIKIRLMVSGTKEERDWKEPLYEEQAYLNAQNGSALLDKFTHCLLVKCGTEVSTQFHFYRLLSPEKMANN